VKVSEFLRQWQLSGQFPIAEAEPAVAFWAGWLVGASEAVVYEVKDFDERRKMAMRCAEFIEQQAREQ
jgi:hypothetical protein